MQLVDRTPCFYAPREYLHSTLAGQGALVAINNSGLAGSLISIDHRPPQKRHDRVIFSRICAAVSASSTSKACTAGTRDFRLHTVHVRAAAVDRTARVMLQRTMYEIGQSLCAT